MIIFQNMDMVSSFHENFQMFPISAKRMIVEISPFYKFRIMYGKKYEMPDLEYLTKMANEYLYYPNDAKYVYTQKPNKPLKFHPNDKYIYEIKKLDSEETCYCNELFLDRINTWVGFSSLDKVKNSLIGYYKANAYPFIPRVDYTELYEIINEKYNDNIDLNLIERVRK